MKRDQGARHVRGGLHKMIEQAIHRPAHRPKVERPHVAQEYAEMGSRGHKSNSCECGRCLGAELRRGLRRTTA